MSDAIAETAQVSSLLKIHYDKRFIPVARGFVESLAATTGINQESCKRLCLLVEESLSFIIDKYIDSRLGAHIEILFQFLDNTTVGIDIVDIGPPIHEGRIPEFDIGDETSSSGLWFKLVKGIADKISFINKHKDGWTIHIELGVPLEHGLKAGADVEADPADKPSLKNQVVRQATPEDAEGLIDLAFRTYRYSYDADYYSKQKLRQGMADGRYEITVAENEGRIAGAYTVKHPASGAPWAEMGSAMVRPEYRTTRTLIYMIKAMGDYMAANPRDCDYFTSHMVTSHPRSQKALAKIQPPFQPLFLFPNMVPHTDFIGISQGNVWRESLIWGFSILRPPAARTLYAPAARHGILRRLLDNTDFGPVTTLAEATAQPGEGPTRLEVERVPQQGFAMIRLAAAGADWSTVLTRELMRLVGAGMANVSVSIPSTAPLPPDLENQMASLTMLFSGLHLHDLDSLDLVYCLTTQRINFDGIELHDPVAEELREHMRAEYEALHQG